MDIQNKRCKKQATNCTGKVGENNRIDFDGEDAAGEWTLTIIDDAIGDSGVLKTWTMEFTF